MSGDHRSRRGLFRFSTAFVVSTMLVSSAVVVGLQSGASATGLTVTEAATFPVYGESLGVTSLSINPQNVGDIVIFDSQIHSTSIQVTGVSSADTGTWHLATRYVDNTNHVITEETWWAVATSTGTTTLNATYSGNVSGLSPQLVADSFTTSAPAAWSFVSGGGTAAAATTAVTFPSLTSGSSGSQIYWGYVEVTQTASGGSTLGFSYTPVGSGNLVTANESLSSNTGYAPTASESPSGNYTAIATIFDAVPTYTVTFNGNNATSGSMSPETHSSSSALTTNGFTRTGYTFTGWNTAADGSGTPYAQSATYPFNADATLYAQWSPNNVTVTFNGNNATGGTMSPETNNLPQALTTNTFTRTGYTFSGWNTAADGSGTPYADGATYPFTTAATLYAQWTANNVTVTFAGNNSTSGAMSPEINNLPKALTANAFARTGYTFSGWNTAANGSGTGYANGATYPFTASTTLYAQWTANNVTVTFVGNGANHGTMSPEIHNAPTALTSNAFTRTGYTFSGWNTAANGSGTSYANGATYPFTASTSLFAQWTANYVKVVFNGNHSSHGSMKAETHNAPTALTSNAFARTGYTFSGWNTAANGSGKKYANKAVFAFKTATTLYAQWTAVPHVSRIVGTVTVGRSSHVTLIGVGFTAHSRVTSNEKGTVVRVLHASATQLSLQVTVAKGSATGVHTFKVVTPSRATCQIRYKTK